jgi:hypothetical protein
MALSRELLAPVIAAVLAESDEESENEEEDDELEIELFFDSSDEDDFEEDHEDPAERNTLQKVWSYAETTVPSYNDRQFKEHFRLSRTTFVYLQEKLQMFFTPEPYTTGRPCIDLTKAFLISLWLLSNHESHR